VGNGVVEADMLVLQTTEEPEVEVAQTVTNVGERVNEGLTVVEEVDTDDGEVKVVVAAADVLVTGTGV
jgi:hypothetical protein